MHFQLKMGFLEEEAEVASLAVRAIAAREDPGSVPNTQMGAPTAYNCSSTSRAPDIFYWPLKALAMHMVCLNAHRENTRSQKIKVSNS